MDTPNSWINPNYREASFWTDDSLGFWITKVILKNFWLASGLQPKYLYDLITNQYALVNGRSKSQWLCEEYTAQLELSLFKVLTPAKKNVEDGSAVSIFPFSLLEGWTVETPTQIVVQWWLIEPQSHLE